MAFKGPFRTVDGHGRQIVQVRFPGGNHKTYAYAVPVELGTLDVGDYVWTEGNSFNPYGSPAAVVKIGSEYSGQFAVVTSRLDKGFSPQTITIKRYKSGS